MASDPKAQIRGIMDRLEDGDSRRAAGLLPLVYEELRKLAASRLAALPPGQTLQATALVHETYLRLVQQSGREYRWESKAHFFGAAARAMRNYLVDEARRKSAAKRGGDRRRVRLSNLDVLSESESEVDYLGLDLALEKLEHQDGIKSDIVHLRYFAGLSIDETAEALRVAPSTVDLHWRYARAWLRRELSELETG